MMVPELFAQAVANDGRLRLCVVAEVRSDGSVTVDTGGEELVSCDLLEVADDQQLTLVEGDRVLVVWSGRPSDGGVVLGRVASTAPARGVDKRRGAAAAPPDELVITAGKSLTLKVGDGSITIREDGRILIKGKDLVSHAKRMNRIRGGSVQIN